MSSVLSSFPHSTKTLSTSVTWLRGWICCCWSCGSSIEAVPIAFPVFSNDHKLKLLVCFILLSAHFIAILDILVKVESQFVNGHDVRVARKE